MWDVLCIMSPVTPRIGDFDPGPPARAEGPPRSVSENGVLNTEHPRLPRSARSGLQNPDPPKFAHESVCCMNKGGWAQGVRFGARLFNLCSLMIGSLVQAVLVDIELVVYIERPQLSLKCGYSLMETGRARIARSPRQRENGYRVLIT
jgi:hypothetical protein